MPHQLLPIYQRDFRCMWCFKVYRVLMYVMVWLCYVCAVTLAFSLSDLTQSL